MSAQVVSVLLGQWKEATPVLAYLHRETRAVTHEKELDVFSAYLPSLGLSATSPRRLLVGTRSELLPPWGALRRVSGSLHWNYK